MQWISVKDKLPDFGVPVMVWWRDTMWVAERYYDGANSMWMWVDIDGDMVDDWYDDKGPTHWQPYPEGPKDT